MRSERLLPSLIQTFDDSIKTKNAQQSAWGRLRKRKIKHAKAQRAQLPELPGYWVLGSNGAENRFKRWDN
jgi:hypothetical protein